MHKMTQEELQKAIQKYRKNHPRIVVANFEGTPKEYLIEQPGLDIIEALEDYIIELERSKSDWA